MSFSSDEVNYLIYRYLKESGMYLPKGKWAMRAPGPTSVPALATSTRSAWHENLANGLPWFLEAVIWPN